MLSLKGCRVCVRSDDIRYCKFERWADGEGGGREI